MRALFQLRGTSSAFYLNVRTLSKALTKPQMNAENGNQKNFSQELLIRVFQRSFAVQKPNRPINSSATYPKRNHAQ